MPASGQGSTGGSMPSSPCKRCLYSSIAKQFAGYLVGLQKPDVL